MITLKIAIKIVDNVKDNKFHKDRDVNDDADAADDSDDVKVNKTLQRVLTLIISKEK